MRRSRALPSAVRPVSIRSLLAGGPGPAHTAGWVRSVRRQKRVAFVHLFDGSGAGDLQVVVAPERLERSVAVGASVRVSGTVRKKTGRVVFVPRSNAT